MLLKEAKEIRRRTIIEDFDIDPDVMDKVTQRVKDHIVRVKYFYKAMVSAGLIPDEYVNTSEVAVHDADKLKMKNLKRQALRYCTKPEDMTPEILDAIQDVVHDHVKGNPHHPEFWGTGDHRTNGMSCSEMELPYIYEMLADWAATAEERGTSIKSWFTATVINVGGNRWSFSDEAVQVMMDCIPFLEKKIDKSLKRNYGLTFIDPAYLKSV